MDKQSRTDAGNNTAKNTPNNMEGLASLKSVQEPKLQTSKSEEQQRQGNNYQSITDWLKKKSTKAGLHDWLMVVFTFVLTLVAVGQGVLALQNSQSSTEQIGRLIVAADRIDDAADSFSKSSADISRGVGDAVQKLNLQVSNLAESARQTRLLVKATRTANENVLAADRPWVGSYAVINAFGLNIKPSVTFYFTNSGKRPARIDFAAAKLQYSATFPEDPESSYASDIEPSVNFIVPGQPAINQQTADASIGPDIMSRLESRNLTYYAFAEVRYTDVKTTEPHITHFCIYYIPKAKTDTDNGFRNCPTYNDAN